MDEKLEMPESARSPVRQIKTDPERGAPLSGVALCLSGGGYRAMLFHTGVLWRLNELAYLPQLDRISSVSGGSITAGVLACNWSKLEFNAAGVATNFVDVVVAPIRRVAGKTIDIPAILWSFILGHVGNRVASAYRKNLFGNTTLQDLPDKPRFVINSTSLQSGVLWRFSKPFMWDYRVGEVKNPNVELAIAVAASSAFPPFLSPVRLKLNPSDFTPNTGTDLQMPPYTDGPFLTDGGVYDNLGLETAWKQHRTILVSNAGQSLNPDPKPSSIGLFEMVRVVNLIDNQVVSLRKRQVIDAYIRKEREGAYWRISSDIAGYKAPDKLPCPQDATLKLAATPTRLAALPAALQEEMINWGYAICDAGMRSYVLRGDQSKPAFPYPEVGVGAPVSKAKAAG